LAAVIPRNPTTSRLAIVSASGGDGDAVGEDDGEGDGDGGGEPVGGRGVEAVGLGEGVAAATQPASHAPPTMSVAPRNFRRLKSGPSFTPGVSAKSPEGVVDLDAVLAVSSQDN
jgi:hypothetical protein